MKLAEVLKATRADIISLSVGTNVIGEYKDKAEIPPALLEREVVGLKPCHEGELGVGLRGESVYIIEHLYDVDGGYGDAVQCSKVIGYAKTEAEAVDFCAKYSNTRIYDSPYADLYKGTLVAKEVIAVDIDVSPWAEENDIY